MTTQSRMAPNGGDDVGRRSKDGRRHPRHRPLIPLIGLVLALVLAAPPAAAFGLPGWGGARHGGAAPGASPSAAIQEVAPPGAVQQLRSELLERRPRLAIAAPADGALLPEGPWSLRLELEDWPLVDDEGMGLGPHLRVQLDDEPPMAVTTTELVMPSLAPGSHRLTVYAAWPWGEAVKDPGACRQIRLHRVAANPLALPPPGSPQLLLVSPAEVTQAEPVLLDWLLLDAPLQNLRDGDDRWRLRVTLNGDSFLVDRQEPLWLQGWRRGANALLLELVDPRGSPLNPPFNSLVREVIVGAGADDRPWRGGRLNEEQLARLLGRTPPAPPPPPEPLAPEAAAEDADRDSQSAERPSPAEPPREPRADTEIPPQVSTPSEPSGEEPGADEPAGEQAAASGTGPASELEGEKEEAEVEMEEMEEMQELEAEEEVDEEEPQEEVPAGFPAEAPPAPEESRP